MNEILERYPACMYRRNKIIHVQREGERTKTKTKPNQKDKYKNEYDGEYVPEPPISLTMKIFHYSSLPRHSIYSN
jgi:hypothetical protein